MNGKAVFQGGNAQSLDNIAGQLIAEYTHSKSGTIHKLEGPEKARNIVFKATGDYNDGDTWTLNNHPVTVTYNGGEELLPTAVLVGDTVQAVIMGGKLRLMLQKPTPQPNLSDNWYLIKPVNQRAQDSYIGRGTYMFDRWIGIYSAGVSSTNVSLTHDGVKINGSGGIRQFFEADLKGRICTIAVLDGENKLFTVTSPILNTEGPQWQIGKQFGNMWIGLRFREDVEKTWDLTITGTDKTIKAVKIELGNRFTGWPVWDYGEELAKCQRYFQCLALRGALVDDGVAYGWNAIPNRVRIPLPVTMRVPPALVSFSGTIYHEQSSETIDDATIYNGSSVNEVVLSLGKKCLMVNGEARLSAEL